jgi:hypothetical protein
VQVLLAKALAFGAAVAAVGLSSAADAADARLDESSRGTGQAVYCAVPGEWPRTRDAAWLWNRLRAAGFRDIGCTGSAFAVDYGGPGPYGHDLYIWAFSAARLRPESPRYRVIEGVRVYGMTVRVAWRVGGRNVWVEARPTSRQLPSARVLARLVRATMGRKRVGSAGVSVSVPSRWQSIPQRPAPPGSGVTDPVTRVVTASGRIRLGRGCNQLDYVIAPTTVALVLVEWVGPTPGARWKPRPARFTSRNLPVRQGLLECFGRGGGMQFAERGRRFAAYLLVGRRASAASIDQARAALDTLRVVRRT